MLETFKGMFMKTKEQKRKEAILRLERDFNQLRVCLAYKDYTDEQLTEVVTKRKQEAARLRECFKVK